MATKPKKTREGKKVVVVSGGFDPIHAGHVRHMRDAKELGDYLVVILNNDNWLRLKKGIVFMPEHERKEIIEALEFVDEVVISSHEPGTTDMSICNDLRLIRPHFFAKGGDRHTGNIPGPEVAVCNEIGCVIVNDIGEGGKIQSSSWLLANFLKEAPCACGSGKKYTHCCGKSQQTKNEQEKAS